MQGVVHQKPLFENCLSFLSKYGFYVHNSSPKPYITVYHPWWICLEVIYLAQHDIQNPTDYYDCELLTLIIFVNNTVCKICGFALKFPFV